MTEEMVSSLSKLLPEIAIAVIFGSILIYYMKSSAKAHEEKTIHFTDTLNNIEEKHAKAYDKLAQSIDLNTQVTKESRDATKEMRETMTQLIIQRR